MSQAGAAPRSSASLFRDLERPQTFFTCVAAHRSFGATCRSAARRSAAKHDGCGNYFAVPAPTGARPLINRVTTIRLASSPWPSSATLLTTRFVSV